MTAVPPTAPPGPGALTPQIPVPDRASAIGYWIGSAVIVLSVVIGLSLFVSGVRNVVDLVKFPEKVHSDRSIEIAKPGDYIVYQIDQEDSTGTSGSFNRPLRINANDVTVLDPSGASVSVGSYDTSRTSNMDFHVASAIATFHAYESGTYHVDSSALSPGQSLGVGSGKKLRAGTIGLGLIIGLGGTLTGVIVLIVTAVRRSRSKPIPAWGQAGSHGYGQPQVPYGQPPMPGWNAPPAQPGWNAPPAQPGWNAPPAQHGWSAPPPAARPGWNAPPARPGWSASPPAAPPSHPSSPGQPSGPPASWPPTTEPTPPQASSPGVDDPDRSGWAAPR